MDNGGSAFPLTGVQHMHGQPVQTVFNPGMTLRDYFAAKALTGLICEPVEGVQESLVYELSDKTCESFASAAYKFADAMLKERAK